MQQHHNTYTTHRKALLSAVVLFLFFTVFSAYAQSNELLALQNSTRNISKKILPSVVTIDTRSTVQVPVQGFGFFFDPFGNSEKKEPEQSREYKQEGLGSGIMVKKDGNIYYVLTNAHVVDKADEIEVITINEESFTAELIGMDQGRDLALISFESAEDFDLAELGDSDTLQQGDIVFAVGNPYGFRSSITFGIVSALDREYNVNRGFTLTNYIQTDAAVNKGNSGGPLVNINGEVVGINTWIYSQGASQGNVGLSFAVPINNAKKSIAAFIEKGEIDYGWLGTQISAILKDEMASLGTTDGILISGVYDQSPADRGGVLPGDIIQAVDGEEVFTSRELQNRIASLTPGEKTKLGILRGKKNIAITITLAKRKEESDISDDSLWPGFQAFDITTSIKDRLDISSSSGVVVTKVLESSTVETAGIKAGDIIERVNNKKVKNLQEFYVELNKVQKNEEVIFRIVREKTNLVVGVVK